MACLIGRFPKAIMRRMCAIETAQLPQPPVEQNKVHGLIRTDLHPVIGKGCRELAAKSADQIEGQIDSHKFDMGQGVQQGDAVGLGPALASFGHPAGCQKLRMFGTRRGIGHRHVEAVRQSPQPPVTRRRPRRHHLGMGISGQEDGLARLAECNRIGDRCVHPSAFAAVSTSAA